MTTVGYAEADGAFAWAHRQVEELFYSRHLIPRAARIAGLLSTRIVPQLADLIWRMQLPNRALLNAIAGLQPNLIIACDYVTIPAALELARISGARIVYDAHEYALREKEENRIWRILYPPYIRSIEHAGFREAHASITVSDGIADALVSEHQLRVPPAVVRNVPRYRETPSRFSSDPITVHYHGRLGPGRGLETILASVPGWDRRFCLRIRGPASSEYTDALHSLIRYHDISERVEILPPIADEELIADAAKADIGIHCLPNYGAQNQLALPNKVFEYVMAGLAVLVADLPEMRRLVTEHRIGVVTSGSNPSTIAKTLNSLDNAQISAFREASLLAARKLNWDNERKQFLNVCRSAIRAC